METLRETRLFDVVKSGSVINYSETELQEIYNEFQEEVTTYAEYENDTRYLYRSFYRAIIELAALRGKK